MDDVIVQHILDRQISTPKQIRDKLATLSKPHVKEVIYDAVYMYVVDHYGKDATHGITQTVESIIHCMENQYKQQLPKKQPKWKNVDLLDSIAEIKAEQNGKENNNNNS